MTIQFTTGEAITEALDEAVRNYQLKVRRQLREGNATVDDANDVCDTFEIALHIARDAIRGDA